ncbi:putrescine-ornithine antiporter [Paraburkholderia caribensis]|uniref:putrescine-ornithine antiporter n=1 Tax=Paraburkholderia caribensis TaxID=75105 RepID=UPI0007212F22|nr:putrescine-ornithine antiporter [Paraburkholderia caribensis]ALP67145.1 amino acid permease [Paraburkholderia caribensis]AUT56856.1 putrescine-ornithine antiporter [Paraburkholderia caribensis]
MSDQPRKMSVVQLTFIVTVNMMGSGIIMLPTNMAKVGAISLLSWLVTAVGSLAIAYGFAEAGLLNQRAGGMAAYAEDGYGKDGYFQVFFLYFLSIAIANVAVASSALGYLAAFFPVLTSSPVATCIGVIALLWLTTVANFGGPKVTGRIGAVTVWGVILPVGFISIAGWFWFHGGTFAAAWNPKGVSLLEGMGSSISLTLWAFLGMESAVQNSSAVENPKRDVPLACMFGTLGAAVIYILSTAAIQGIVPNADLAASTGPFGLAFARMFNPAVGSIVMALAALACVGSLLGWQFTLAQTAKDAADCRMFPGIFGKANSMGAPIAGMVIMGVVQSLMALSTISPNLSEQFAALVNLAVVTNVLPYIISLSALFTMMRNAGTTPAKYRLNAIVTVIALAYSVFAIYASGKDAVLGGMLVMAIGYVIYGFMAFRFTTVTSSGRSSAASAVAALAIAFLVLAGLLPRPAHADEPASAGTLARVKESGTINLGYLSDAQPFSYKDQTGRITGYTVALCQKIADEIKAEGGLGTLKVNWVAVTPDVRLRAVQEHRIDLLCGDADTLAGRAGMSFSIPVYPGGIGAVVRSDAPAGLKEVLSGATPSHPTWRAVPAQLISRQTISVVDGSPAQRWLGGRLAQFQIAASVVPVSDVQSGVRRVLDRQSNVFFGERSLLLAVAGSSPASGDLTVLDRHFTYLPVAIGMARGDDNLRLLVDRTLSRLFATSEFPALYARWFGSPDADTRNFFRLSALPE